jgi:hypothetical protein
MSTLQLHILNLYFCVYNLRFWKYKTETTLSILRHKTLPESPQEVIATPSYNYHRTNPIDQS